ncbi:hypothetical protein MIND_01374800 [Mycena indigotica]|uniref:Uncharacterized protein n=1 Tax=Mycena indigotica TaxID=2126181 RepID=A0A8H6RYA6_9AGAR|nr:uncharacterized protein MIND_01374800 [Mycena indigotica]KAF7289138.1 hypothetical protein MIND_01374800 [Mycena indigotica]
METLNAFLRPHGIALRYLDERSPPALSAVKQALLNPALLGYLITPGMDRNKLAKGMWERLRVFGSRVRGTDKRWDEAEEQGLIDVDKTIALGTAYCRSKNRPLTVEGILEVYRYRLALVERGPIVEPSDANVANFESK